jgi:hypothetical protein
LEGGEGGGGEGGRGNSQEKYFLSEHLNINMKLNCHNDG